MTRRALFTTLGDTDHLAIGAGLIGIALGVSRFGFLRRIVHLINLRRQRPTASPKQDIEQAFERLELAIARRFRERHPHETRREFIDEYSTTKSVDSRVYEVLEAFELARYHGIVSRNDADRIIDLVNEMVRE